MPRFTLFAFTLVLSGVVAAVSASAQDVRRFDNQTALDNEIAGHMAAGLFSNLVAAVAPPDKMSPGRIRIQEDATAGGVPTFTENATLFGGTGADGMTREVTAWWDGAFYVYLGIVSHERADGVYVLDFMITGDIRRASRWYLTAAQ